MIVPSYHAPTVSDPSDLTPGSDEQIPYNPQGPLKVSVVVQDGESPSAADSPLASDAETGGKGGIERA